MCISYFQSIIAPQADVNLTLSAAAVELKSKSSVPLNNEESPDNLYDLDNPIQMTTDMPIVVNGVQCILGVDAATGQLHAYPARTPQAPRPTPATPVTHAGELVDIVLGVTFDNKMFTLISMRIHININIIYGL